MTERIFVVAWSLGVVALVAALFVARIPWRGNVERFARRRPVLDVLLHPDRDAENASVGVIRLLSGAGWLL